MAGAHRPPAEAPRLRAMRAAQDILSAAEARRGGADPLDSFASAAGLMQLSSAAAVAGPSSSAASSGASEPDAAAPEDAPLPPGWNRVIHSSGLACYAHFRLGVVTWSRPYALGPGGATEPVPLPEPEFMRLAKKHVPPLSVFAPPERAVAQRKGDSAAAAVVSEVVKPAVVNATEELAMTKRRKMEVVERTVQTPPKAADKYSSMSAEEFRTLAINDPRVLQACMELSVKTPAQVLQEYQNRNRGVSINYNTVPFDDDGVKLFKTIVTAGSTVAEGVASTKKIAKQLGAQQLLALLHERTASTYMQVAELYSGTMKGPAVAISETAASSAAATAAGHTISNSLRSVGTLGRPGDARFGSAGGGSSASASSVDFGSRLRKFRRQADEYPHYDDSYVADHRGGYSQWGTYHQETPQWASGSSVEREDNQGDNPGPERIVVYSSSAPASSGSSYSSYYSGGNAPWTYAPPGGLPPPPAGNLHGGSGAAPSYSGVELENRPRQFGYGGYRSAAGERVAPLDRTKGPVRYQPYPSE